MQKPTTTGLKAAKASSIMADQVIMDSVKSGGVWGLGFGIISGLLTGLAAGWASIVMADGIVGMASVSAKAYLAFAVLLPVILFLITWMSSDDDEDAPLYITLKGAFTLLLTETFLGSLLATGVFFVVAINVIAIFGRVDQAVLRPEMMSQVGWNSFAMIVGIAVLSALPLALWGHRQALRWLRNVMRQPEQRENGHWN